METLIVGEVQVIEDEITVNLITIYDKANTANISDKNLRDLIKAFHQEE